MDNINNVEEMTDKQFMEYKETLLKLVLEKLESSEKRWKKQKIR